MSPIEHVFREMILRCPSRNHSYSSQQPGGIVYARSMDAISAFLEGPRASSAFLLRSIMDPPWSLRIEDEAPLTIVAVVRGEACIVPDGREPARLAAGGAAP